MMVFIANFFSGTVSHTSLSCSKSFEFVQLKIFSMVAIYIIQIINMLFNLVHICLYTIHLR